MDSNNLNPGAVTLIEFFGAPGVGKTYLAKVLVTHFRAAGVLFSAQAMDIGAMPTLQRVYSKLRYIVPFVMLKPFVVIDIFKFVFSSGVRGAAALAAVTINWLFVLAVVKRGIQMSNIVVLDQGWAQAYWSMVFRGARIDAPKYRSFICRLLDTCGVEVLLIVDVNCVRAGHRVQLASRENGRSPLDDGDPIKFELGLQVTESVRNILCRFESDIANPGLVLLKYENDGGSNYEELYENFFYFCSQNKSVN